MGAGEYTTEVQAEGEGMCAGFQDTQDVMESYTLHLRRVDGWCRGEGIHMRRGWAPEQAQAEDTHCLY